MKVEEQEKGKKKTVEKISPYWLLGSLKNGRQCQQ